MEEAKLSRIEALFAGATTEGEKRAAAEAKKRIQLRLQAVEASDPPIEYRLTAGDAWSRKVLLALLRRYDLKPYRYRNQRHTTVMVKVPASFVNETLWAEFEQISSALRAYVDEVTERILADVLHGDSSEAPRLLSSLRAHAPASRRSKHGAVTASRRDRASTYCRDTTEANPDGNVAIPRNTNAGTLHVTVALL
jgi:hypothetical protein